MKPIFQVTGATYDIHPLALACAALEQWDEALRFSPLTARKSSVTYQKFVHLATLWNRGDREKATELAKQLSERFKGDMDEAMVRRDMDAMLIGLTEAVVRPSTATAAAFREEWDHQKRSLRNRPLENYFFALVLLKAGTAFP